MQLRDPLTGRLRSVRAHPFGFLAMGATIALIPWTLLYIAQFPDRHTASTGSGLGRLRSAARVALGVTAWSALRERAMLIVGLIVSSALLVCDAWFDVVTSLGTEDQMLDAVHRALRSSCRSPSTSHCWPAIGRTAIRVSRPSTPASRAPRRATRLRTTRTHQSRIDRGESRDGKVDVLVGERGGELSADARLAERHHRIGERDGVDAVLEQRSAAAAARCASPNMTGTIGCSPGTTSSPVPPAPAGSAPCGRTAARAARRPRAPADRAPPGWRRRSAVPGCWRRGTVASAGAAAAMASRRPLVKPPLAPPRALPSVPVTEVDPVGDACSSGVPRPSGPTKPTAWESSTMTIAS